MTVTLKYDQQIPHRIITEGVVEHFSWKAGIKYSSRDTFCRLLVGWYRLIHSLPWWFDLSLCLQLMHECRKSGSNTLVRMQECSLDETAGQRWESCHNLPNLWYLGCNVGGNSCTDPPKRAAEVLWQVSDADSGFPRVRGHVPEAVGNRGSGVHEKAQDSFRGWGMGGKGSSSSQGKGWGHAIITRSYFSKDNLPSGTFVLLIRMQPS